MSIDGRIAGGFPSFGKVADFASCDSGEGADAPGSSVVADRRRDFWELPDSIDDKLGDLMCDV